MNILIVGAGTVGTHLAETLVKEGHSLVVIDTDAERIDAVGERLDVQATSGEATDHALLEQIGIREMDLVLAMTNIDEVNLVCSLTCKRLGAKRTIARVRNAVYLDSPLIPYRGLFEIDLLISPEMQTALEIAKFLETPDAIALESFAHGKVQMRQVELEKPCEVLGKPLADAGFPEGVLVAAITRGDDVMIPGGKDRLHLGDAVTLVGHPEALEAAEPLLGQTTPEPKHIVILGGGEIARNLVGLLGKRAAKIKLIERDPQRSKMLSATLERVTVICGDATNSELLREENIGAADVFIATTGDDEDNIMGTQLALELGVKQSIVLIHRPDYATITQRMGFDHVLSPRVVASKHILSHIRDHNGHSATVLGEGAEIVEIVAAPRAAVTRKPLSEIKLPAGSLICAIVHGDEMRVAHGAAQIEAGDTVITIALTKAVKDLRAKFA